MRNILYYIIFSDGFPHPHFEHLRSGYSRCGISCDRTTTSVVIGPIHGHP
ncbi:MAG: hypothetical protein HY951_19420 [Bacteroidia bacterium]|nr:hypothetical protein [Bacteroidia bacterium]